MELIGALAALAIIIVLNQRGHVLYRAVLVGIIIVILTSGLSFAEIYSITLGSLRSNTTITLALIIITMTAFGNLLKETGALKQIMLSLSALIKDLRYQVVILPLFIGLIAFPGGAIFSAPLVEEAGSKLRLSGLKITVANVTFRHIQFLIYPLYPGLLLTAELSGIGINDLIKFNLPVFALFFFVAFKYVFRGVKADKISGAGSKNSAPLKDLFGLLYSLGPLIVIVFLAVGPRLYIPLAILVGIMAALISYYPRHEPLWDTAKIRLRYILGGINWSMTLSIVAILVFKDFLEYSAVIDDIMGYILGSGLPLLVLVVVIPYLSAIIFGNYYASMGICIPLFLPVLPGSGPGLYYMALIFIASLAGYFGSPLHMCTILTVQYFKAPLPAVLKEVNILGVALVLIGIITALVWRLFL